MRYQLRPVDTDTALHPWRRRLSVPHAYAARAARARLSAAEQAKFDEIQPPCMAPLIYAAGSRDHRTSPANSALHPTCAVLASHRGLHPDCAAEAGSRPRRGGAWVAEAREAV